MKKILSFFAICLLSLQVSAQTLKEGVHYEVISETATAKPEVKEFFSFYCGHCLAFEPLAKKFKSMSEDKGFEFKKSHVDFLRAAGPDIQMMLTKALVTAEKLNKPEINDAIFSFIHKQRSVFTSEKDVKQLFIANGVTSEDFDKAFNSFAIKAAAKRMKSDQNNLANKRILTGVPTFIVNGKYKIINQGFEARTYSQLFDKIEAAALELVEK